MSARGGAGLFSPHVILRLLYERRCPDSTSLDVRSEIAVLVQAIYFVPQTVDLAFIFDVAERDCWARPIVVPTLSGEANRRRQPRCIDSWSEKECNLCGTGQRRALPQSSSTNSYLPSKHGHWNHKHDDGHLPFGRPPRFNAGCTPLISHHAGVGSMCLIRKRKRHVLRAVEAAAIKRILYPQYGLRIFHPPYLTPPFMQRTPEPCCWSDVCAC